jgi:polysaccharide biosynthesis transport protein
MARTKTSMSDSRKYPSDMSSGFSESTALAPKAGDPTINVSASSNGKHKQLATPAVDLFHPGDRFTSVSRIFALLHRWQLLFRKYWWVVPLIVVAVIGPVCFWTFHSAPVYESQARMWLAGKLDITEGRIYTEELLNYLGTQAELLRSPVIHKRALARLGGPYARNGASTNAENAIPAQSADTNGGANARSPFKVSVVEESKSSIMKLRALGPEPAVTQAFLTYLMEEYLMFRKEAREKSSDRTLASATAQVSQLASEVTAQQEKLHAFQSSNNVVFLQEQGNSAGSYLATLNRQLATLHNELRLLQLLQPDQWMERETGPRVAPPGDAPLEQSLAQDMAANLAGPQLELFKVTQQMQVLKAKREEISRFLRPLHPKIVKLNEEIATQEKMAETVRDEAVKQMNHRRQAIELEIQSLETASVEWDAKAIDASRKMADYDRIRQDLQRMQAAYDRMLGLIQRVDLSKNVEQENVAILEPASAAQAHRPVVRNLGMAVVGSFFLAFGLFYLLGLSRDDFSSTTELSNHVSEEVVGNIPAISIKKPKGQLGLELLEKQRFEFLESFRQIRSSLLFMGNGCPKPKTLVIASSIPEEGKSTVALYLAATMAMGNSRVLLIDADMRRGSLHEFFGAASGPGLAEVLNREIPHAKAIVQTGLRNLALVPAGKAKRNPGELVLSSEWDDFLAEAREQFDYVLVDTPPVLAADDAGALAPKVDGVLLVVRGSYTSARMVRGTLDALRRRHVHVIGLILNRAISSRYERQYYGRYRAIYSWQPQEARA